MAGCHLCSIPYKFQKTFYQNGQSVLRDNGPGVYSHSTRSFNPTKLNKKTFLEYVNMYNMDHHSNDTVQSQFSDNLWFSGYVFFKDFFSIYYIQTIYLVILCNFVETKNVTKSRLHSTGKSKITRNLNNLIYTYSYLL